MQTWKQFLFLALCGGVFALAVLPSAAQQSTTPQNQPNQVQPMAAATTPTAAAPVDGSRGIELPDSPGAVIAKSERTSDPNAGQFQSRPSSSSTPSPDQQAAQPQTQSSPQRPVGTAAAGAATTTGVAASQPAGVAIAPAKQRRRRTILLRTGAIVAGGIAVGSIVALTAATPSKPPGAH